LKPDWQAFLGPDRDADHRDGVRGVWVKKRETEAPRGPAAPNFVVYDL
jgi:hypothetical protein